MSRPRRSAMRGQPVGWQFETDPTQQIWLIRRPRRSSTGRPTPCPAVTQATARTSTMLASPELVGLPLLRGAVQADRDGAQAEYAVSDDHRDGVVGQVRALQQARQLHDPRSSWPGSSGAAPVTAAPSRYITEPDNANGFGVKPALQAEAKALAGGLQPWGLFPPTASPSRSPRTRRLMSSFSPGSTAARVRAGRQPVQPGEHVTDRWRA